MSSPSQAARSQLLNRMLADEGISAGQRAIPKRPDPETAPLSFAQHRIWFLNQFDPDRFVFNSPAVVRFSGKTEISVLQNAFNEVVRRHEVLRTTFSTRQGEPVQIISPPKDFPLRILDVRMLPELEREAEVARIVREESRYEFDLSCGPLARGTLLRVAEHEYVLVICLHHIVSDAWSASILIREIGELYDPFCDGRPSPLPELAIQYGDYAAWQREWFASGALESELEYWKRELAGAPHALDLPIDYARPAVQSYRGAKTSFELSSDLTERVRKVCRQTDATMFMVLLAAFNVLLHRYTGATDILVGCPIANRTAPGTQDLIGFFVNTVVIRSHLADNPLFREVVRRVRRAALGAYAHQDLPFEKLVQELPLERDLSRTPLFQVLFNFQRHAPEARIAAGLTLRPLPVETEVSKYDLTLYAAETEDRLVLTFEYASALFKPETIDRMAGHLERLLRALVVNPDQRLSDLTAPEADDLERILVSWNGARVDFPPEACIHELFSAQAGITPDARALVFREDHLTFGELDARANQLANYLRSLGVGPEVLVGLSLEASLDRAVGLLGILKAGGAYVPLDPFYPTDRLAFMVEDSRLRVLVTQERLLGKLPAKNRVAVCLDRDSEIIGQHSKGAPSTGVRPKNLAYLLYTSGSTGTPKGVLGTHRDTLNCFHWMWATYPFQSGEVCCQKTTLSFGDSIQELLGPLLKGVCSVVIPDWDAKDPYRLTAALAEHRVSRIVLVPSLLRAILDQEPDLAHRLPDLKLWIASGETLPPHVAARFLDAAPDALLVNLYGCSEASNDVTWFEVSEPATVPIGRPIANVQVYLLDSRFRPVPPGVPGQIAIGGIGLVRGYLNRPDLTGRQFVPDPFSPDPGSRLYLTGDLGRHLPDGVIEFVGRLDHQVKIRGCRIELGDIEAGLGQHPDVAQALVIVREDAPGERRLAAYVVPKPGAAPAFSDLRAFLAARYPDYMIPDAFVVLDALPLTPSGKVSRRALPAPVRDISEPVNGHEFSSRTHIEEELVRIWSRALRIPRVGIHDSMFELGGHSLLAARILAEVRETFGVDVPLRSLFERPTVAELAQSVQHLLAAGAGLERPPIARVGRDQPLPLSLAQERQWILHQLAPGTATYNVPIAIRLRGALDESRLARVLNEIISRHEILRSAFPAVEGRPVQKILPELHLPLPVSRVPDAPESASSGGVLELVREESRRPFDLTRHPLVRARLLRLQDDDHALVVTMPHILIDGWSVGILFREMSVIAAAVADGRPSPLPELQVQFADYAVWQHKWLQGEVLEAELADWTETLRGAPPRLAIRTDYPRPEVADFQGALHSFEMPLDLVEGLEALSRREGVTFFMAALAAWTILLHRYSGQADIVVGSFFAGRTRPEVEPLIGFFVNTVALRVDISGDPGFVELLKRVREVVLGAYAHQDLPFEKVIEALEPERSLAHTPIFQVGINLVNIDLPDVDLPGLKLTSLRPAEDQLPGAAQLDLSLNLRRSGDGTVAASIVYDSTLFAAATIARIAANLQMLIRSAVSSPSIGISKLGLLTEVEHRGVLSHCGASEPLVEGLCIHDAITAMAKRSPEAIAVVAGADSWSYRDLELRSCQIGAYLQSCGIDPGDHVAVLVERSPRMIAALLGTLKAGAACVPLEPGHPPERLGKIIQDCDAKVVLVDTTSSGRIPGVLEINIESEWDQVVVMSDAQPHQTTNPRQAAFIIYTSGSTGAPKGVVLEHRSLLNYFEAAIDMYQMEPSDRVLQFSSIAFDASLEEIFPCLMRGATLVLRSDAMVQSPARFFAGCEDERVSVLGLPTAYWHELVEYLDTTRQAVSSCLRLVIIGGERLLSERLSVWQRCAPLSVCLINTYGPAEASVVAVACKLPFVEPVNGTLPELPIGRPVRNMRTYVLDARMAPVPIGVAGELYLGGEGLARGYMGRPDLTAERFLPDPYRDEPGARLYRTGDICRYRSDGLLEYLGRTDHQVKVRGFRIELGEIEAALAKHKGVRQAAVIALEQSDRRERRLVAYVVPAGADPGPDELQGYLAQKLPGYMIPPVFIMLPELPLTASGKVDRTALPPMMAAEPQASYKAPRTVLEEALTGIWADVLGVQRVGVDDNFFALGGHSLLITRLVYKVAQRFQVEVPYRRIFEGPTVACMAAAVEEALLDEIEQLTEEQVEQQLSGGD